MADLFSDYDQVKAFFFFFHTASQEMLSIMTSAGSVVSLQVVKPESFWDKKQKQKNNSNIFEIFTVGHCSVDKVHPNQTYSAENLW